MKTLSYEKILEQSEDKEPIVVTAKYDGILNLLFINKDIGYTITKAGQKTEDYPALYNAIQSVKKSKFNHIIAFCEVYGVDSSGKQLPLNKVIHITRKPTPKEELYIHIAVFDIYILDGRIVDEPYWKRYLLAKRIFGEKGLSHAVIAKQGGKSVVEELWNKNVVGKDMEGLVIHLDDVVKVKPIQSYDVAVIAVQESSTHKNTLGSVWLSFMDKDKNFRYAGKVGTGFSDEDRKLWWEWAKKNTVSGPDKKGVIWVKPKRILEVFAERVNKKNTATFNFIHNEYEELDSEKESGVLIKPRVNRERDDKQVTPRDLRLTQIPDF